MITKLFVTVAFATVSTLLFRWAAGGLGVRSLNIVSITYYIYIALIYVGASAIYLGLANDYYMVGKISNGSIQEGYFLIAFAGVVLPLVIGIFEQLFGRRTSLKGQFDKYRAAPVIPELDEEKAKKIIVLLLAVCVLSTLYTFYVIGGIPFIEVLFGGNEDAVALRAEAKTGFSGLVQIRNLGMLQLAPAIALLCQICYRTMTSSKWRGIYYFSLLLACIVLTYNLEKAPVVFFMFEVLVLEILLGRTFTRKQIVGVWVLLVTLLVVMYLVVAGGESLVLSLTAGPIGRALLAYPAAFMLHIQAFPGLLPFLGGAGLPMFVEEMIGAESGLGRSAVAVMTLFNTQKSTIGFAYAMNTFFPAEAFANWGIGGYLFSLIWVGSLVGLIHSVTMRHQKNLSNIFIYIMVLRFHIQVMLGGFIDYLFSINLLFVIFTVVFIRLLCRSNRSARTCGSTIQDARCVSNPDIW